MSTYKIQYTGTQIAEAVGKALSSEEGAQKNVQSDWNATEGDSLILNKPQEFPPEAHEHTEYVKLIGDIATILDSINGVVV